MPRILSLLGLLVLLACGFEIVNGFAVPGLLPQGFSPPRSPPMLSSLRPLFSQANGASPLFSGSASAASVKPPKVGVLLMNLGGPKKAEDVQGFLYNLFSDPGIIRLPSFLSFLQKPVAWLISSTRKGKATEAYESIGGGSPILRYTTEQSALLESALMKRHGLNATTYIAMRYWHPFLSEALHKIYCDKIDTLVVLPLYPHFSVSTTGTSLIEFASEVAAKPSLWGVSGGRGGLPSLLSSVPGSPVSPAPAPIRHTVIPSWHLRPGYIKALARLVSKELELLTPTLEGRKRHVLFTAHGVPKSYVTGGDVYQKHIVECVDAISRLLPEDATVHLSYQSRVGPIEWLKPYTDDAIPALGKSGVRDLVVVPISFVSEHIETLEEIDQEYYELAHEHGIDHWRRCPALNADQEWIDDLADAVVESLSKPIVTAIEACVDNNCCIRAMTDEGAKEIGKQKCPILRAEKVIEAIIPPEIKTKFYRFGRM